MKIIIFIITFILLCNCSTNVFLGKYSDNWNNLFNWSLNRTPIYTDNVFIDQFVTFENYSSIVNQLHLNKGAYLYLYNSSLKISNYLIFNNTVAILYIRYSSLVVGNNITVNGIFIINNSIVHNHHISVNQNSGVVIFGNVTVQSNLLINDFAHLNIQSHSYLNMVGYNLTIIDQGYLSLDTLYSNYSIITCYYCHFYGVFFFVEFTSPITNPVNITFVTFTATHSTFSFKYIWSKYLVSFFTYHNHLIVQLQNKPTITI